MIRYNTPIRIAYSYRKKMKISAILIPLLMQDKVNVLEKYLSNSKSQQKLFVQFLDKRFADGKNLASCLYLYSNVKDIRSENLSNKYLGKLLTRLIKQYEIDASICPNIYNQRYFKNLRYLIFRRYVEKSLEYEPWKDLITECLTQVDYLSETFIEMLAEHQEFQEIQKWLPILNVKIESLSSYIQTGLYENYDQADSAKSLDVHVENKFYKLKLEDTKIKFIETKEFLFECLNEILECKHKSPTGHMFVGIDTEWKPSLLSGVIDEQSKRASLIQISTHDHVYLIDSSKLHSLLDANDKQLFNTKFIINRNLIKIGYGFSEDIKKISHSFGVTNHEDFRQSVLDLEYMVGQLMLLNVSLFDNELDQDENNDNKERGLSELVRLCFGKPLNKSEQISNWDKRPLRKTQMTYAALDAYVLLEIFEYIRNRLAKLKINFDIHKCIGKRHKQASTQQDKNNDKKTSQILEQRQLNEIQKFEDETFTLNATPVSVKDLRIVCDNMLGGLGKELRRCGIDTIILENERRHTDVGKIARHENRYAVSSGLPYFAIKSQLPEGRCIHVNTQSAKSQCTQVLRVLNVSVKVSDLFSRCRACNTGSYTIISKNQAKALWSKCKEENPDWFAGIEKSRRLQKIPTNVTCTHKDYDLRKDQDLVDKIDLCTYYLVKYPSVRVQFESIFDTTLEVVDTYYICDGCGHIYWEGPHWQNITSRFSHVLTENEIKNHINKD